MAHHEALRRNLQRINRKGYKAYKDIIGSYEFPGYRFMIDHVQGDPFASPSRARVVLSNEVAGFQPWVFGNDSRQVALRDFVTRSFQEAARRIAKGNRGIGKSGMIAIDSPGQEILERSSVLIVPGGIEVRFVIGLPAAGRTILGHQAIEMIFQEIPGIVEGALLARSLNSKNLEEHVNCFEDQDAMRAHLAEKGLVAFLGNGSILPRRSGVDDRPMIASRDGEDAIPFQAPPTLEVTLDRPNCGPIRGLGISPGVTLVVGGGFHGKSTLLKAIERSVYNHVPGDGRELVVTSHSAVKIKAEEGRYVEKVNISPFIQDLPFAKDTRRFSTENASGSTSQAANIMEALEAGSELLLIDEDTSATNFMIRDERMQALVPKDKEPITPFVDKVHQLYTDLGVSTILIMGGSGDYFDGADQVLMMEHYRPIDVLKEVRKIRSNYASKRSREGGDRFGDITARYPLKSSFQAQRGRKEVKIDAKGLRQIQFGTTAIDLKDVDQLVDASQTRAIGRLIHYLAARYVDEGRSLREGLESVFSDLAQQGWDLLGMRKPGNLARPRLQELAGAINRMRSLRVR